MSDGWKLHVELDWRDIWQLVFPDRDPVNQNSALPQWIACPWCFDEIARRTLFIGHDPVLGGQHFWCAECGRSGDMLQLAADGWKLEISATVARLRHAGFARLPQRQSELVDYLRLREERRRVLRLIDQQHLSTADLRHNAWKLVWKYFRMSALPDRSRLRQLFPGFAATTAAEVEAALQPWSAEWAKNYRLQEARRSGSAARIFRGRHWHEILALACWDLPGRIGSLFCIGRDGLSQTDHVCGVVHYELRSPEGGLRRLGHTGLHYHPTVPEMGLKYDGKCLVLPSVLEAARLQARQMLNVERPLPLIGLTRHDRYGIGDHSWQIFRRHDLVFVTWRMDAHELSQTILRDGQICQLWIDQPSELWLEQQEPEAFLEHCLKSAVPWEQALSDWIEQHDDSTVGELLWQLTLRGVASHELQLRLSRRAREIARQCLARCTALEQTPSSVLVDRHWIQESEQGWFVRGPAGLEQICNGRLRIDRILCSPDDGRMYYQGRILLKQSVFPFCADKQEFDRHPFAWMERHLLLTEAEVLTYNPRWSDRAVLIARQLQPPQVLRGTDCVGWSEQQRGFILPHVRISAEGQLHEQTQHLFPVRSPAENLRCPVSGPWTLSTNWSTFLPLLGCVLAELLAPPLGLEPRGGRIYGRQARQALELLALCLGNRLRQGLFRSEQKQLPHREMLQDLERHHWPLVVWQSPRSLSPESQDWLRRQVSGWLICNSDPGTAWSGVLEGRRWSFAARRLPRQWSVAENSILSQLLLCGLSRGLQRLGSCPEDWTQRQRFCVQLLAELTGCTPADEEPLLPDLLRLLGWLRQRGALTCGRHGWCPETTHWQILPDGSWWLSKRGLSEACTQAGLLAVDPTDLVAICKAQGLPLDDLGSHWKGRVEIDWEALLRKSTEEY